MGKAPCYGCEHRVPPDCHSGCEAYQQWAKERAERRDRAYAVRMEESKIMDFSMEARKRNGRGKRGEL